MNIDQSRFDKETHRGRTLRYRGTKNVFVVAGNLGATTQSYCIMPIISMDGTLHSPIYVLVSERSGQFPKSKADDPPNIRTYAYTRAMMGKSHLVTFMQDILFPTLQKAGLNKVLLLHDTWSVQRTNNETNSSFQC